jgi:hypothetical protein
MVLASANEVLERMGHNRARSATSEVEETKVSDGQCVDEELLRAGGIVGLFFARLGIGGAPPDGVAIASGSL